MLSGWPTRRILRFMVTLGSSAAAAAATPSALSFVAYTMNALTAGGSKTVAVPTGTTDGDMMLLGISHAGAVTVTPPAGWTLVQELGSGTSDGLQVYYRIASSEPTDYTVTYSASNNTVESITSYRSDTVETIIVDTSAETDSSTPATSHNAPSVTTTKDNAQLVCFTSWSGIDATGLSAPGDMAERFESASGAVIHHMMDRLVASAGATGTKTVTGGTSQAARLISVAIAEDL